jgi:ribosome-binding protein aMBF1 (putative translation factor)
MRKKDFYTHQELHRQWMKSPGYRKEYQKLEPEFQIAREIIKARIKRKITQEELAKRAKTGQAVISRLENMTGKPSFSLVQRVVDALGLKMEIRLSPR